MTVPTILAGNRATAATLGIQSETRIVDMSKKIFLLEPTAAPLTKLSSMLNKSVTGNPVFKGIEDQAIPGTDTVNGTIGSTITTLVMTNGAYWQPNSLAVVQETLEVIRITNVSGNSLTIERSWGSTAAATITDADTLTTLGGMASEGAPSEASKTTVKAIVTMNCQIFRWAFQVTNTVMASDLYGGPDMPWQQKKAGIEQLTRIERAFLSSEPAEVTTGNEPVRSTGGMFPFITTNSDAIGGAFNMLTFFAVASDALRYGRKDKLMLSSRIVSSSIAADASADVRTTDKTKTFGMDITKILTPHGTLRVVTHDLLEGPKFGGYALIVDLDNVGIRHMAGRDNHLVTNIQTPGADSRKDEYVAEIGLFRVQERTHAEVTGVT